MGAVAQAGGVPVAATGSAASASAAAAHPRATSRAPFAVRLSSEHTAAAFELDCSTAVKAVELHSGGKNSQALAALGEHAHHIDVQDQREREREGGREGGGEGERERGRGRHF